MTSHRTPQASEVADGTRTVERLAEHPVLVGLAVLVGGLVSTGIALLAADVLGPLFWLVQHAVDLPAVVGGVAIFRTGRAELRPLATALLVGGLVSWAVSGPLSIMTAFILATR